MGRAKQNCSQCQPNPLPDLTTLTAPRVLCLEMYFSSRQLYLWQYRDSILLAVRIQFAHPSGTNLFTPNRPCLSVCSYCFLFVVLVRYELSDAVKEYPQRL